MREKLNTCNFSNFLPAPQILFLSLFSLHYKYLGGFGGAFKLIERRKYITVLLFNPLQPVFAFPTADLKNIKFCLKSQIRRVKYQNIWHGQIAFFSAGFSTHGTLTKTCILNRTSRVHLCNLISRSQLPILMLILQLHLSELVHNCSTLYSCVCQDTNL